MLNKVVLLFIIFFGAAALEDFSIVRDPKITAFRRTGSLVDGVVHAHIALHFNLTREVMAVRDLADNVKKITLNSTLTLWAPVVQQINPLLGKWEDFRCEMDSLKWEDRPKRQVLAIAAGAAMVVSAGAGAFALYETKQLSSRVDTDEDNIMHLFAAVKSNVAVEDKKIGRAHV